MNGSDILDSFKKHFGNKIIESRIDKNGKVQYDVVWIKIDRDELLPAVKHLFKFGFPHFAVISANDFDDYLEFIYEFSVGYGKRAGEVLVNFKIDVKKNDLELPSICQLIPGALVSEREKQELFGVKIKGIPDGRKFFLDPNLTGFPGIKKDERISKLEVK